MKKSATAKEVQEEKSKLNNNKKILSENSKFVFILISIFKRETASNISNIKREEIHNLASAVRC